MHITSINIEPNSLKRKPTSRAVLLVLSAVASIWIAFATAPCLAADEPAEKPADTPAAAPPDANRPYAEEAVKHFNRGVELHQAGFLNQAIKEYEDALAADNRLEEAWSNLGCILALQKSYPKATDAFEKALSLKADRPTTLNGYATVLYARGKIKEAKEKWEQALKIDPKFGPAYYNLGNALEGEHNNAGAVIQFAKAIDANQNMADAYYRLGAIYVKQKHLPQARVLLNKALELSPDADYVRDARKELVLIDAALGSEKRVQNKTDEEVPMTVHPPADSKPHAVSAKPEASSPEAEQAAVKGDADSAKPSSTKASDGSGSSKKFSLFKHKSTKQETVDMFVQQPDKGLKDSDLKESPESSDTK